MTSTPNVKLFDLALPVMYVAPQRTLTSAYLTADTAERFEAIRHAADARGITVSLLYRYWDAAQQRYFGTIVLDQTNTSGSSSQVSDLLSQVPGVTLLSASEPASGLVAFEQHRLSVAGTPVAVVAVPFLGATHRRLLENLGDQAATLLFQAGESAGQMAASGVPGLVENLGVQLTPTLIRERFSDLQVFGWATIVDLRVDDQFTGEALLRDDFEAGAWQGQATDPVCHWIRGFITGALSSLTGHPIEVRETECQAKGDAHCRMTFHR